MNNLRGFSLIELLVSISIISILIGSALFILKPQDYLKRTRDSRRQSDLKVIQTALEQYYANNSGYPASGLVPFGSNWTTGSPAVTYLRQVPQDPSYVSSNPNSAYCYSLSVPTYSLCTTLETSSGGTAGTCTPISGSPTNYNYCLANPF